MPMLEEGDSWTLSLGMEIVLAKSKQFPQKLKARTATASNNPTTGDVSKDTESVYQRDICMPMMTATLSTTAKNIHSLSPSSWMNKENMWYIYKME